MRKIGSISVIGLLLVSFAIAGGIVTNTNQSEDFHRQMNRNTSIDVDTVYYYPAGLSHLKNAIKFNLLSPIVKTLSFSYERSITDLTSVQLGLSFVNLEVTGAKYTGYSIEPEYRIYPAKMENLKVYFAPFARYHNAKIETLGLDESGDIMSGDASYTSYGAGIIFGGKFLFKNIAVLDIFLGPSYTDGNLNINNGEDDHFMHFDLATGLLTGISFRAGISIGVAF